MPDLAALALERSAPPVVSDDPERIIDVLRILAEVLGPEALIEMICDEGDDEADLRRALERLLMEIARPGTPASARGWVQLPESSLSAPIGA